MNVLGLSQLHSSVMEFIVVRATGILDTDRDGVLSVCWSSPRWRLISTARYSTALSDRLELAPVPYFLEDREGKLGCHRRDDALFLVTAQQVGLG